MNTSDPRCREIADPRSLVDASRAQAKAWTLRGRWDEATALLTSMRGLAAEVDRATEAGVVLDLVRNLNGQDFLQTFRHGAKVGTLLAWLDAYAEAEQDEAVAAAAWHERALQLHLRYFNDGGDPERERELFDRAIEARRRLGHRADEAMSVFYRACVDHVILADAAAGLPRFERAYELAREEGDLVVQGLAVRHLGQIDQERGDLDSALTRLQESLDVREQAGWYVGTAPALIALAEIHRVRGEDASALSRLAEARVVCLALAAPFLFEIACTEYEALATGSRAPGANVRVVIGPAVDDD